LDELTFEPGEIITVVPFDDPEEQVQTTSDFMETSFVAVICISFNPFMFGNLK